MQCTTTVTVQVKHLEHLQFIGLQLEIESITSKAMQYRKDMRISHLSVHPKTFRCRFLFRSIGKIVKW